MLELAQVKTGPVQEEVMGKEANTREGGRGLLPKILGSGVRPATQNPYRIYDQNMQFSLPYLWPDQKKKEVASKKTNG